MEKKLRKMKGCVIMSVTYSMSQLSKAENWKNKTKSKTFHFFDEEFYRTNIPKIESQKHFWKRIILNKTMAEESTEEVRNDFTIFSRRGVTKVSKFHFFWLSKLKKIHWFTKFSFLTIICSDTYKKLETVDLKLKSTQHLSR